MEEPFTIPSFLETGNICEVQNQLRKFLASSDASTVRYENELLTIPSSITQARKWLQIENIQDNQLREIRLIVAKFSEGADSAIDDWGKGIDYRFFRFMQQNKTNHSSLLHDFIEQEAKRLYGTVFRIPDVNFVSRLIKDVDLTKFCSDDYKVIREDIQQTEFATKLISYSLEHLYYGLQLSYSLTVGPLTNLCALGLWLIKENHDQQIIQSERELLKLICNRHSPVYPGLFREINGEPILIPTTWPGTKINFTFGYGTHSCPGKTIAAAYFTKLVGVLKSLPPSNLIFYPRKELPFGIEDIIVTDYK